MKIKQIALMSVLFVASALAGNLKKIDGVPFHCSAELENAVIAEFGKDVVESGSLAYSCRHRENRQIEDLSWCDGNGCAGGVAIFKDGKCEVHGFWSGQDDGDAIDPEEQKENCLVASDFSSR